MLISSRINLTAIIIFLSLASSVPVLPQQRKIPDPTYHKEVKTDEYIPVSSQEMGRSPAYRYSGNGIFTVQVNVASDGQNIVGDAANEPSIAIDRNNPNRMAIGWRQFNTISSSFRQAGYGYTTNGGENWVFPGVIDPGVFRSDPVLESDAEGNFYYNSLTNSPDYFCKVFKSTSGGSGWDNGTDAKGGDKQWMTIDKTGGIGEGNIYSSWNSYFSTCYPGFFTRSINKGASFQSCIEIPLEPYWGTMAVNSSGELFVAGTIGYNFLVAKSSNAQNPAATPSWNTSVVSLDGIITFAIDPNPGGLGGQTNICIDTSGGPYNGNIYVLCSVDRNSITDPADVMFTRSTNGGVDWSTPKRINDDPGTSAYQWFGTMSVAPNGRIDVVWLDTRGNTASNISALYYSFSRDGGVTWSQNKRLSDFFNSHLGWPQQDKMGDYFDMISVVSGAHLAWAATFNGEQDVFYSFIVDSMNVPAELVSFSTITGAGIITLNWTTATEINNYGFEVERSTDKQNWLTIGFKEGNGTSTEPRQYSFTDRLMDISNSKLYYRLKQVDYNGNFEYSQIAEALVAMNFSLSQNFPNPFNPVTSIKYQFPENGFVTLRVYDILGKEAATLVNEEQPPGNYEVKFDAGELTSGVYFYKLTAGEYSSTRRMILLK